MAHCRNCKARVDDGATRCTGCDANLVRPGAFAEVLGWVLLVLSAVPIIVGEKTMEQRQYAPLVAGGVVLVAAIILVIAGRSRSRGVESPTVEADAAGGGPPAGSR